MAVLAAREKEQAVWRRCSSYKPLPGSVAKVRRRVARDGHLHRVYPFVASIGWLAISFCGAPTTGVGRGERAGGKRRRGSAIPCRRAGIGAQLASDMRPAGSYSLDLAMLTRPSARSWLPPVDDDVASVLGPSRRVCFPAAGEREGERGGEERDGQRERERERVEKGRLETMLTPCARISSLLGSRREGAQGR